MILINKNSSNDIFLSLQEKSQLWQVSGISPYYLFVVSSDTTNAVINFVSNNLADSNHKQRADEFIFIESGSTYINLSAGTLNLSPGLFWTYTVFEQTNQYNFNTSNCVGIVETGKLYLSGSTTGAETTFTYTNPNDFKITVYNP